MRTTARPSIVLFLLAIVTGWVVFGAASLRADGKVFASNQVPQQIEMPDQRALLAWENGIETLVIESAFVGEGTEFAWVVPLPSKPEVFPATSGTLPAAVALMQPVVAEPWSGSWAWAVFLGSIGLIALLFGWHPIGVILRIVAFLICVLVVSLATGALIHPAAGWFALSIGCVCAWPLRRWFGQEMSLLATVLSLVLILLAAAVVIPTVGAVRSAGTPPPTTGNVTVERQQVGDFDVAVIAGEEGEGVVGWLETNRFFLGDAARTVAVEHASAGGWFVASRVRREFAQSGRSVPAPLAFRFPTQQPVYPMRLTGTGAERPLNVELIVFGPSEAEVSGLTARSVAPLEHGEPSPHPIRGAFQPNEHRRITHPELKRWTNNSAVATWLRGDLSPTAMTEDLLVRWTSRTDPKALHMLEVSDAWERAALLGSAICFFGAIALGFRFQCRAPDLGWSGSVLLMALLTALTAGAFIPKVAVEPQKGGLRWYELREFAQLTALELFALPPNSSDERVQNAFKALCDTFTYDSKPITQGDAPGEVMLHKLPNGKWRVWFFDAYGQPGSFEQYDAVVGMIDVNQPAGRGRL